jgi:glycerol-3-phosphate acyltransferase PlsX
MRIAIDAMGGDHAPQVVVEGVLAATREFPDTHHLLVGDLSRIEPLVKAGGTPPSNLSLIHAAQVIEMGEPPVEALRKKRDNSISVCARLVRDGKADGFISAGNTGGAVAAAIYYMRQLEGVKRAGIAVPMPTEKGGRCIVIDVGANLNCRPIHLLQYGVMASIYAREVFHVASPPRVGLLNVGTEAGKGNWLMKECFSKFERLNLNLNFVGNIEGLDVFRGTCDVVVCDGYVGNVLLKASESCAELLIGEFRQSLNGNASAEAKSLVESCSRRVQERTDYAEVGGAPLLGVQGLCVISHGRSSARAIANAVRYAREFTAHRVNEKIVEQVRKISIWGRLSGWFTEGQDGE